MMMNCCYFRRRRGARVQHEGSGHLYQFWASPEGNYSSKSNKHSQYPVITDLSHSLWNPVAHLLHSDLSLAQWKHTDRHTWHVNSRLTSCQQNDYIDTGFTFPNQHTPHPPVPQQVSRPAGHIASFNFFSSPFITLITPQSATALKWSLKIIGIFQNSLPTLQKTNWISITKTNR